MQEMEDTIAAETTTAETETPAPDEESPTPAQPKSDLRRNIIIGVVVVVVLALTSLILYGMATNPIATAIIRDISIIVLALVTMITTVFLAILLFQLQALILLLREEIYPILNSINETTDTVRGTTTFVSDAVVSPVISAMSYVSGLRQSLRVLSGSPKRPRSPEPGPDAE